MVIGEMQTYLAKVAQRFKPQLTRIWLACCCAATGYAGPACSSDDDHQDFRRRVSIDLQVQQLRSFDTGEHSPTPASRVTKVRRALRGTGTMFRSLLRPRAAVSVKHRLPGRAQITYPAYGPPPIRILGPTLWCFGAVSAIYLGCAAYEVRQDARVLRDGTSGGTSGPPSSYEELEANRAMGVFRKLFHQRQASKPYPTLHDFWESRDGVDKMMMGAAGSYAAVLAMNVLEPGTRQFFEHVAASPRNYTLLTSTFGHVGFLHFLLNAYGLYNFGPAVASTRTFQRSGSHLTAFYLSSGIMASLAWHLTSIWPSPMFRLVPALGASGAIFGLIGAFGMSYPNARIGIILVPGSLPASQALAAAALFEAYGLFVGFKRLRFAHAAHLAGLAVGAAYVQFDGNRRLWQPARRFAFKHMRRLNML